MSEEQLVKEYTYLVEKIAKQMYRIKSCSIVELRDIEQAGFIGLIQTLRKYSPPYIEAQLSMYIRSRMIDEFRKYDHLTRHKRELIKSTGETTNFLVVSINTDPDKPDPFDDIASEECTDSLIYLSESVNTNFLSDQQKDLFTRLMRGEKMQYISDAYGESRPTTIRKKKKLIKVLTQANQ